MKQCILLVGHGSRESDGNKEIEKFVNQWREAQPNWHIELCFIEFAEVLLDQGLDNAARNADQVVVVPFILNAAGHVKMEIPQFIAQARQRHPETEFIYASHIGVNDTILSVLKRQLLQAMKNLDMPDPRTTGVVLLARGSSDRQANGEVAKLARWIYEDSEHDLVDIAFTGITHPRLENVVQRQARLGMTQVVVLPYYLFTGTLMLRIYRQVKNLQQLYPTLRFAHGDYFGFEAEIFELLNQRVEQAVSQQSPLPCDGCHYREIAAEHGAQHHHHDGHSHSHELVNSHEPVNSHERISSPTHHHEHRHAERLQSAVAATAKLALEPTT